MYFKIFLILNVLLVLSVSVFSQSQDSSVPEQIRRPERGEFPRYPEDLVIGAIGQGNSPTEAYTYARNLLSALAALRTEANIVQNSLSAIGENALEEIKEIGPRSYRIGGGRIEKDGSVSFLMRFLGSEESITGELFLRTDGEDGAWVLDDLILEEKRAYSETRESYRFDFSPYERFF